MLVKYIGKADQIIGEYDGKRYVFNKRNPVVEIPVKVYDYIKASRGMRIGDIIPYYPESVAPVIVPKEVVQEETSKLKHTIHIKTKGKKK